MLKVCVCVCVRVCVRGVGREGRGGGGPIGRAPARTLKVSNLGSNLTQLSHR